MFKHIVGNTPEQQEKIDEIMRRGEEERRQIARENLLANLRIGAGAVLSGASAHPILNIPYIGTGIGGALEGAGQAIMKGKSGQDIAKDAGIGFLIGETVGAIPYAGKLAGKTKAGQAVISKANGLYDKIMATDAGKKVSDFAKKAEDVLMTDIKAFNPNKQTAYHGSPYDFNKFSNEAIGTGEGAQAHGYGHYAAVNKDVADTRYRKEMLARKQSGYTVDGKILDGDYPLVNNNFNPNSVVGDIKYYGGVDNLIDKYKKDLLEATEEKVRLKNKYPENFDPYSDYDFNDEMLYSNADILEKNLSHKLPFLESLKGKNIQENQGQLYKLSIPKDDVMLREGATFAEQPVKVQQMYRQAEKNKLQERLKEIQESKNFLLDELEKAKQTGSDRLIYSTQQMLDESMPSYDKWTNDISEQLRHIDNKDYYDNLDYRALLTNLLPENTRPASGHLSNKESQIISEQLNKAGIKGISYNGGIDGEARVIFNPDDIEIVRKYYNQPELWDKLKGLRPNEGAELAAIENALRNPQFPMDEQDFNAYEDLGLRYYQNIFQPNVVDIPNYGITTFSRKNRGKDDVTNFKMYPDLFELLAGAKTVKRTNYKNEPDRQ